MLFSAIEMADRVDIVEFIDSLQATGRYSFTDAEAEAAVAGSHTAVAAALRRQRARGRIVTPRRGFDVIVPTEYREAGSPPAAWFIDDLMRFVRRPYYVALLSAAAVHGAAHQQPMRFQVITDAPLRSAVSGRARLDFHVSSTVDSTPVLQVQTDTGYMRVSTPEATAFDLVRFIEATGGLGNVATVLAELAESLRTEELRAVAMDRPSPEVQRLGYLLDSVGRQDLADPLARALSGRRVRPVVLASGSPRGASAPQPPWRVIVNESVELDL